MKSKKGFEIGINVVVYLVLMSALILAVILLYIYFTSKAPDASAIKFSR